MTHSAHLPTLAAMRREQTQDELGPFQFVILILSLLLLAALAAEWLLPVPREVSRLLMFIDTAVCVVFLTDFLNRFFRAPSKLAFMKWGWIDLLASIPAVEALRWGRVFRVARIVRLLVGIHSIRRLISIIFASQARAGLASIFVFTFMVVSFSSTSILLCENDPDANIYTAEDALWWSFVTITTVGYGDHYPVTTAGRIVAAGTMFAGVGLFGALSGVVASLLLGSGKDDQDELLTEVRQLRAEVTALRNPSVSSTQKPAPEPEKRDPS